MSDYVGVYEEQFRRKRLAELIDVCQPSVPGT